MGATTHTPAPRVSVLMPERRFSVIVMPGASKFEVMQAAERASQQFAEDLHMVLLQGLRADVERYFAAT